MKPHSRYFNSAGAYLQPNYPAPQEVVMVVWEVVRESCLTEVVTPEFFMGSVSDLS